MKSSSIANRAATAIVMSAFVFGLGLCIFALAGTEFAAGIWSDVKSQKRGSTLAPLPLSETMISELENAWDLLPAQVEVSTETNGWRVTHIEDDSILARAGFRKGDLIPSENIDNALADFSSPTHRFAKRIIRIMNRITN